ncbi:MAG: hypothetical protein AAFU85_32995, partial [Planctomycetota bacterium]
FLPDNTELAAGLPADDLANFDQNPFAPGSGGAGPQSNEGTFPPSSFDNQSGFRQPVNGAAASIDETPPATQLAAIRKMRSEVEAVIKKMTKHRQKLLELENRLSGKAKSEK